VIAAISYYFVTSTHERAPGRRYHAGAGAAFARAGSRGLCRGGSIKEHTLFQMPKLLACVSMLETLTVLLRRRIFWFKSSEAQPRGCPTSV